MEEQFEKGLFYHGTKTQLKAGDLLTSGYHSNFLPGLVARHIYFTEILRLAVVAAAFAVGKGTSRVYLVKPTGEYEIDPNLTSRVFVGNPARSYRTLHPLRVVEVVNSWERLTAREIQSLKPMMEMLTRNFIN